MNRTIKFRAWDKVSKSRVKVNDFTDIDNEDALYTVWTIEPVSNVEIQQFTGLHDKNGKEMYEGDIVKYETNGQEVTDTVVYIDSFFGVGKFTGILSSFYPIEVIGDVYSNPELLNP